jgi:dTDP-4-dehydrorhamnose reductase
MTASVWGLFSAPTSSSSSRLEMPIGEQLPTVLVVGASGQVARALARRGEQLSYNLVCRGRGGVDITAPASLEVAFRDYVPALVINAAAYAAVDRAEGEQAAAFAVNAEGPEHLARLCHEFGAPLIHLSTDYVFDGTARRPYCETDPIAPLGVYGMSKAAGEEAVRSLLPQHLILRTAWLYSSDGHNFLNSMLRLGAERSELGIVDDQTGSPTFAQDVADALLRLVPRLLAREPDFPWGTYHLVNEGQVSWYGFASEIFRVARETGRRSPVLKPIATANYPTAARRPAFSVLDTRKFRAAFGFGLSHWRASLSRCLEQSFAADRVEEELL